MDDIVLHDRLAVAPWMDPALWRLPGIKPLDPARWIIRDEAFEGQMRLRDRLIAGRPDDVHCLLDEGHEAALECLELVLGALSEDAGYGISPDEVRRPDGVTVDLDRTRPLVTLGRLTQADVCLVQPSQEGHVLTGAILCFPASWTLAEKIGKPLAPIHAPVPEYDADVASRVQRLFDAIRPERPLWRANAILHRDPSLYHPRSEIEPPARRRAAPGGRYLRSERQTLRRLPRTGAVVFTIHTTMIPIERLTSEQRESMAVSGLKSG